MCTNAFFAGSLLWKRSAELCTKGHRPSQRHGRKTKTFFIHGTHNVKSLYLHLIGNSLQLSFIITIYMFIIYVLSHIFSEQGNS